MMKEMKESAFSSVKPARKAAGGQYKKTVLLPRRERGRTVEL
jgi:hypothetical protein